MTKELEQKIKLIVPKMEGWCNVDKALAMAKLILETNPTVVVELGVFGGRSLIPQALALREADHSQNHLQPHRRGILYGVDPWQVEPAIEGEVEANAQWWLKDCPLHVIHEGCMKAIWDEKLEPYVIIMRCRAEHALHLFAESGIDILHFDQNHSEMASMRDIQIYYPLVKVNGYIWFDDTNWTTTNKAQEWVDAQGAQTITEIATPDGTQFCRLYRKGSFVPNNVAQLQEPVLAETA